MAVVKEGRFVVEAASRHPRLNRDYDPVAHKFIDRYLHPRAYAINVDAFPGKILSLPKGDQQLEPGGDPKSIQDIWELTVPTGTTGFAFSVEGRPARLPQGPQPPIFRASLTKRLVTTTGVFHDERDDNAWNWQVFVPGPGRYVVEVRLLGAHGGREVGTSTLDLEDLLVVSIGDSAASGQGNPDIPGEAAGFDPDFEWWQVFFPPAAIFELTKEAIDYAQNQLKKNATTLTRAGKLTIDMDPDPVWLEPRAYRSLRSGPAHAARLLENRKKGRVITFLPFGRTGSSVTDGLLGPRTSEDHDRWIGNLGQVEEVARTVGRRRIDALLIYIGVNDIGVASTLEDLVKDDNSLLGDADGNDTANRRAVEVEARKQLANLPDRLRLLRDALADLEIGQIYLIEYPTALFDGPSGRPQAGCGVFSSELDLDLSKRDAELVKELTEDLNSVLREQAAALGWIYISGIAQGFAGGHGYCLDKERRFFIQAEESLGQQGDTEGTIHPNPLGVAVIAEAIRAAVKKNTVDAPRPGVVTLPPDPVKATPPASSGVAAAPATRV